MATKISRVGSQVFTRSFEKVAALPNWLHNMAKGVDTRKSVPSYSTQGLQKMLMRRGLK